MFDPKIQQELIEKGRAFTRSYSSMKDYNETFESDQMLKKPQPPLCKEPVTPAEEHIPLCRDFSAIPMNNDLVSLIRDRRSSRVYTQEVMTLDQLSFLLWATQGIKSIRGRKYATLRTVPCGGARHEFETYLLVNSVEGLKSGAYHYLPMEHALEYLGEVEGMPAVAGQSLSGQSWADKANVVFYWSMVAYRAEWRYGIFAHRVALIDSGHLGQNLYLACTGLGLGTCGVAAFDHDLVCSMFKLDGVEEYPVYTAPVGTIRDADKAAEAAFYQFVEDEGL